MLQNAAGRPQSSSFTQSSVGDWHANSKLAHPGQIVYPTQSAVAPVGPFIDAQSASSVQVAGTHVPWGHLSMQKQILPEPQSLSSPQSKGPQAHPDCSTRHRCPALPQSESTRHVEPAIASHSPGSGRLCPHGVFAGR